MARTPLRPDDPTRIGHYRLTARLGSGGMGVVYLGVSWDGAPVAVKVLRPELAGDQEFRRRFGREVAALVRVKGVCTVRVIEADSQSSTPFVVTEYAPGPSLSEYIDKHGSVGPEMLFGLATGLAEALTTIHAAGIMHRDLKPSNIILTDAGPKVIDFGIARRQDTTAVTKTGMMIGSMGFMAPEQISGHPGPEADIFAWGVTVAYAATGRSPFGAGNTHSILYRIMYGDADIASVPDSLLPLVEASLAKDPQSRPTAQQLLDRLTSASSRPENVNDTPTQVILARTWQSGSHPSPPPASRPAEPNQAPPRQPAPAHWPHIATVACRTAARRTVSCGARHRNAYRRLRPPRCCRAGAVPSAMAPAAAAPALREDTGGPPDGHHRHVGAGRHAPPPPQPPGRAQALTRAPPRPYGVNVAVRPVNGMCPAPTASGATSQAGAAACPQPNQTNAKNPSTATVTRGHARPGKRPSRARSRHFHTRPGRRSVSGSTAIPGRSNEPVSARTGGQAARGAWRDPSCGILAIMPELIRKPSRVAAAGQPPKLIDEYVGRANTVHRDE